MIHYHGTPITPETAAVQILKGRHAMVSFADPVEIGAVADVCQSFALDNGAFARWKRGVAVDWKDYYLWAEKWLKHPACDWALIPDVIDGTAEANDRLVAEWPFGALGVPVWHLDEPVERLRSLAEKWPRVALGSSGGWSLPGTARWWQRMAMAMEKVCADGRPLAKLHGLRMLDPHLFTRFPFASADSTNVARNIGLDGRWRGNYQPASKAARGIVLADRIEASQSAALWADCAIQETLFAWPDESGGSEAPATTGGSPEEPAGKTV